MSALVVAVFETESLDEASTLSMDLAQDGMRLLKARAQFVGAVVGGGWGNALKTLAPLADDDNETTPFTVITRYGDEGEA